MTYQFIVSILSFSQCYHVMLSNYKLLIINKLLLQLQPFYGSRILSRTTRVSRYQKGKTKTNLNFLEQETVTGSGISCAICKSAPHPRQIIMPAPQHNKHKHIYSNTATTDTSVLNIPYVYTDCHQDMSDTKLENPA